MNFDKPVERVGTNCAKWDLIETLYGVDPSEGTAMWVADMDFEPPQQVLDAISKMHEHAIFGYHSKDAGYNEAICGWMERRHNWKVDPSHVFATHGLVNGTALTIQTFTSPGDGVILFTPVYHAFARVIHAADRHLVECELVNNNGRYEMDFDAYDAQMTGNEKMLILCSPHNPGGRVWTQSELEEVAEFAKRHDLIIVSDEIHHDLTFGATHIPMPNAVPGIEDRLVMMTAPSKTFNMAAGHTGNVIIADPKLREKFAKVIAATGTSPNSFGIEMTKAAYNHGDVWLDGLRSYLDENRRLLDATISEIPALKSMTLEATYLAWVDFSDTGMIRQEFTNRVQDQAKIAANHGPSFGAGGENFLRFNFATQRAVLLPALEQLKDAFSDMQ